MSISLCLLLDLEFYTVKMAMVFILHVILCKLFFFVAAGLTVGSVKCLLYNLSIGEGLQ